MNSFDLRIKVIRALLWSGSMRYIGQVITWGITLVVIRLLTPSDYGLMAMAGVIINFLTLLSEFGLGVAIVQSKNLQKNDISIIFGFLILANSTLALILFLIAPIAALFYSEPKLTKIIQILSLNFILMCLYVIPQAMLARIMDFRLKSLIELIAALACSGLTLVLAIDGWGVWSLVWGSLAMHFSLAVGFNIVSHSNVLPSFSIQGMRQFLRFGSYIAGNRLLWYIYDKADLFIGGRYLGKEILGSYSVALELSAVPLDKFLPVVNQVALTAYSKIQIDITSVRSNFLRATRMVALCITPAYGGIIALAPNIVHTLFGEKWQFVVFPLQILCLIMPLRCYYSLFLPVLVGINRPDVAFKNVAVASILMPIAYLMGVQWGIIGLCISWIIGFTVVFIIVLKQSLECVGLTFRSYLSSIRSQLICSISMTLIVLLFRTQLINMLNTITIIVLGSMLGIIVYLGLIYIFDKQLLNDFRILFRSRA